MAKTLCFLLIFTACIGFIAGGLYLARYSGVPGGSEAALAALVRGATAPRR